MAISAARPFSHPGDLKAISPKYLTQLLAPYTSFLESRGVNLSKPGVEAYNLDYTALTNVLMTPDASTPCGLIDSLQCIREVATPEAMDHLLREAEARGLCIEGSDLSPADLAVRLWLRDRHILEYIYAQQFLIRPCTFVYFQEGDRHGEEFRGLSPSIIRAFEGDLDGWFQRRKRGQGCRVFVYPQQDGIWFLIWHGAPLKREGCIENGEPSCICYRPERYDVLVYHPAVHELQIDASASQETEVYRRYFGRHFFGDDHHFPGTAIYSLDPLISDGERALVCSDVYGMELVRLCRIEFITGNKFRSTETIEAADIFAAINAGEIKIPHNARLSAGGFRIRFSDSRVPREVALRPSNIIYYQRDSDCVMVEPWLRLRGFMSNGHLLFVLLLEFICRWFRDIDSALICLPSIIVRGGAT